MKRYRVFDHTADLGVEILGKTVNELYANAVFAVYDLMADLSTVEPKQVRKISVEGTDREDLLVNCLREALDLFNGEKMLLKSFAVHKLDNRHLEGNAKGEAFDPGRHKIKREIKAVTYHGTQVRETSDGWCARVIFDV
jgi:SHS2 domain-containing protein